MFPDIKENFRFLSRRRTGGSTRKRMHNAAPPEAAAETPAHSTAGHVPVGTRAPARTAQKTSLRRREALSSVHHRFTPLSLSAGPPYIFMQVGTGSQS